MLGLGNILTKGGALLGFPNKYSFNFDGSNDYLKFEDEFVFSGAFTVSLWVKHNSSVDEYTLGKQAGDQDGFILHPSASRWKIANVTAQSNTSIVANQWHHILAVRDSSNLFKWYVNGSSATLYDGSSYVTTGVTRSGDFDIDQIGRIGSTLYGEVQVDEVAFWDTALSVSDVAKIASKPVDFSKASTYATDRTANLKLWLRCGDKVEPETSIARSDFYTDFDGTDDFITGSSIGISGDATFSIAFWAYWSDSSWTSNFPSVVGNSTYSTGVGLSTTFNNGKPALDFYNVRFIADSALDVQRWYHIAFTKTAGNISSTSKIYVNGVEVAGSLQGSDQSPNITNSNIKIGHLESGGQYWEGKISNVALYKTALDAQTISQMAKSRYTPMRDNRFSVVDFDGTDDGIDCGQIDVSGQSITLSAWVFRDGTTDDTIAGRWSSNGAMLYCSGSSAVWYINGNSSSVSMPDKTWVHIVGTFDGVNRKVYKDGVLGDTDADTGTIVNPSENFEIGRAEFSSGKEFNGSISSVSLYNTAKSAEEIYAIYQQGITYDESSLSGLVGYWRMGDDTSKAYPTIADSSSNSNDGTMTSMTSDDIVQQMVAGYDMGAFEGSEELGAERVLEPSFASSTGWATDYFGTGWSITGNKLVSDGSQSAGSNASADIDTSSGFYKVVITVDSISSGTIRPNLENWGSYISTSGTHTQFFTLTGNNDLTIQASADFVGSISFVSAKEVLQSEVSDTYPAIIDVNEPVLGVDQVTNGTFDSDANWTKGTGWSIGSGVASCDGTQTGSTALVQQGTISGANLDFEVGKTYKITFDVTTTAGAISFVEIGGTTNQTDVPATASTATRYLTASSTNDRLRISGNSTFEGTVDNVVVKEVFGNVGTMTNQDSADLVYSSVLPDQSFLTGANSSYGFGSFDGTNDIVTASAVNTDYKSFSVWVKPTSTITKSSGGEPICSFLVGGFSVIWIGAFASGDTDELVTIHTGTERTVWENAGSASFPNDSWTHLALVWDGSKYQIYYNGEAQTTTTNLGHVSLQSNQSIFIGRGGTSRTEFFDGDISGVALWNKSLSASEVSAIHTAGRHTNLLDSYSDNLITYLAFGNSDATSGVEDTSSTIYDRSGNSNHGTVSGTTLQSPPNAEPNGYAKGDTNRSTTTP